MNLGQYCSTLQLSLTWLGTIATAMLGTKSWVRNAIAATTATVLILLIDVMATTVHNTKARHRIQGGSSGKLACTSSWNRDCLET